MRLKNKKLNTIIILLLIIALILILVLIYNKLNLSEKIFAKKQEVTTEKNAKSYLDRNIKEESNQTEQAEEDTIVEELDKEKYNELIKQNKTVLIDFYATWCGPCIRMTPEVTKAKKLGVPIYKINVDKERELAAKLNVRAMPTIVAIKNGKVIKYSVGYKEADKIKEFYELLEK